MSGISNSDLRSYGMLAFPLAVAGLPLYLHAPDFYVTERGLSLSLIGLILLLVRVLDAVQDPVIGALSDTFRAQRRRIMLISLAGLSVGMICLFTPPTTYAAVWFSFWVIVATTCFSFLSINLNTIGGIWSHDTHEKTTIASSRERFGLIGVLVGVMIPGMLVIWMSKSFAFAIFAVLLALVFLYCGWRFAAWSGSNEQLFSQSGASGGRRFRMGLPRDKSSRRLVLLTLPSAVASALPAVLFLFFVRDVLGEESLNWVFLLVYFIAAVAGIPVWRNLSKRHGKVRSWSLSIALAIVSFVAAAFVADGTIVLYLLVCLFTGFALGGDLVFPASLMADFVDRNDDSRDRAGSGYAWLSFVQKAGLGVAAGVAFPVLDLIGFETGAQNTQTALLGLTLLYAIVPLGLKSLSLLLLWTWRETLEGDGIYEKEVDNNLYRAAGAGPDTNWM